MIPISLRRVGALGAVALLASPLARGERDAVLKQISVPHPYYYREMYLPQVTSGPNAAAWSPDGQELVYAMQGTLWRQKLGSTEAVQLTDGPGYDSEPDWSSDGRFVVYTSYRNDALELRVLDLEDGKDHALVSNGAVNLDARWSPDGRRVAYVSTAHESRWHVFLVPVENGVAAGEPVRITEDRDGGLPRIYYSRFDHYLSPAWSPDGRELILVSNRGSVLGSGGLWRMEARPGAPMRSIRNEETNWKARPDWARDGRRVVYSSYLGRQRNQLWLTTSDGADPMELTYCDCDHVRPRWSPDGRRIAFVSNGGKDGNVSLRVLAIPGGREESVRPESRRYLHPAGTLRLSVTDAAGRPVPARLSVTGADGRGWAPDDAWRHADDSFDRRRRSFEASYFHSRGSSKLTVPAGRYTVLATRGLEYASATREVTVPANAAASATLRLDRLADFPARGWWSGDLHVHMNYGGAYRNDPARLRAQAEAEDVHVVEDLIVNKEQRIPDVAVFLGAPDPASTATTIVKHDEEYHTGWWGHTGHLGLNDHLILPILAGYLPTALGSLFPDNAEISDLTRGQGGLSGYVHPFGDPPPPDPEAPDAITNALPADAALGKVDYVEIVSFNDHRATAEVWYRLLNAGFRIPAGAGTDAMANFASLRGPIGLNRVFVRSGPKLDYRAWLDALRAGRTFATNGPLLTFTLEGRSIGDEIALPAGGRALEARVTMRSIAPVERLEIVSGGQVAASVPLSAGGTRADATISLPVRASGWYTVRAMSAGAAEPILDIYPFATTSPIYVVVDGRPIRSEKDARYFERWVERLIESASAHAGWNDEREKREVLARLAAAKSVFEKRAEEAARP